MEFMNYYVISSWTILLLSVIALTLAYVHRKLGYWKRRGIPSPTLWNYFSEIRDILTKPVHTIVLEKYRKYGKIYGSFMGFTPLLHITDPSLIKLVLVKDFHVFPNRLKIELAEPTFDKMLNSLEGEDWKRVRCIVSPTFSSGRMRKMAYLVRECAEKFQTNCLKAAESNKEVDCKKYFSSFSLDVIASTAFGTKVDSLDNPDHPFVKKAAVLSGNGSALFGVMLMLFPKLLRYLSLSTYFGDTITYLKETAERIIEGRDRDNIRANDFLQLLLDAQRGKLEESGEDLKDEDHIQLLPNKKSMSLDELYAQCIIFFLAGNETTTTTLVFFCYYMALHPSYQQKLIEEIDDAWENNKEINFNVLSKMPYLDAVICEVARIQPLAVQLFRTSTEDYELGNTGITIEKGVCVVVPTYAMHRDPEFFPNPDTFDPDRFLPENRASIPPYVYLPFGEGPRNCVGMRFALMVVKLCVIHMLRVVRLEATDSMKKPLEYIKGQSFVQPKNIFVRMIKRGGDVHL